MQVLCAFGGVYADSDVVATVPIDEWLPTDAEGNVSAGLLVGLENLFQTKDEAMMRGYARQVGGGLSVINHRSLRVSGTAYRVHYNHAAV